MEESARGRRRMHDERTGERRDRLSEPFDLILVEGRLRILDVREVGVDAFDLETLETFDQSLDVPGLDSEAVQSRFDLEMNDCGSLSLLLRFSEPLRPV